MDNSTSLINIGTLVSGLAIAATTGLFWFAYTHPRSYIRISSVALLVVAVANMVLVGYTVGFRTGAGRALDHASLPEPKTAFDTDPLGWTPMLIFAGIMLIIIALQFIHKLKDD